MFPFEMLTIYVPYLLNMIMIRYTSKATIRDKHAFPKIYIDLKISDFETKANYFGEFISIQGKLHASNSK